MSTIGISEIIKEWRARMGGYVPVPKEERREAYRMLLKYLKDNGYEEQISLPSVQNRIIDASVNLMHDVPKKLAKWKAGCQRDLEVVIHEFLEPIHFNDVTDSDLKVKSKVQPKYEKPAPREPQGAPSNVGYRKPTPAPIKDWTASTIDDTSFLESLGIKKNE